MKWYRISNRDELVNLEKVENIELQGNEIKFYFYGEDVRYLVEIFETKEKAEKCFNKIAKELGTDDFCY